MTAIKKNVAEFDPTLAAPLIKKFEGCSLKAYKCPAGILTIGYGHTHGVTPGITITEKQAEDYLVADLNSTKSDLQRLCRVPITEGMFIGLMSFVYNIGYEKCKDYSLFKALNAGNYYLASSWFPKYCMANGRPLAGLKKRRQAEQQYFNRDGF